MDKPKRGNPNFIKGAPSANPNGRRKGEPNKTTQWLRSALLGPFNMDEFKKWAKANPEPYYTKIVSKLIPNIIVGDESSPVAIKLIAPDGASTGGDNLKKWAESLSK